MKRERLNLIQTDRNAAAIPLAHILAERACRDTAEQELREPLYNAVELAKQPGLLYRLHAMLNV